MTCSFRGPRRLPREDDVDGKHLKEERIGDRVLKLGVVFYGNQVGFVPSLGGVCTWTSLLKRGR